ncbi:hypothetical protein VTN31DRAFT_6494 [Thermomyces dupontii]|uniref:uncharacterized protein n=1 Tax=Talaromyces thermophilus TaxID=28565 RepID=UPI0037422DAF
MAQALDVSLRCNSLKCRASLKEKAVVTTCSHIFCLSCADRLGLSKTKGPMRQCPACETMLPNPDDAVSTVLNPTEDYKSSVLSGLDPSTIVDCAGRALSFWVYQTTQEICYQEYLSKSLTEKYKVLDGEMERIVHNAQAEIEELRNKLSEMQLNQEQLQKKNDELIVMYQEKCRKHTQMTNLYNLLKSRAMKSQIKTAASDSSERVPSKYFSPRQEHSGVEQLFRHQRSGSAGSGADILWEKTSMPPPRLPSSECQ